MRALGVDLGTRRIGLALSDRRGILASPWKVVEATGDLAADARTVADAAREAGAEVVVMGLPLSLDGSRGPAARRALRQVEELRRLLGDELMVEVTDERLTTVSADAALAGSGRSGPERRREVDRVAASVLLQAWLDGRANRSAARSG